MHVRAKWHVVKNICHVTACLFCRFTGDMRFEGCHICKIKYIQILYPNIVVLCLHNTSLIKKKFRFLSIGRKFDDIKI